MQNPPINPQELYRHTAFLQRLAARLVDSRATADDLVQETMVAALQSPPDTERSPRPWLAQVLRNLVRNQARRSQRWTARSRKIAAADEPLPSAEDLLTRHEAQRLVAALVTSLEEPFRSTVLLCYGEGLSPSEVATKQQIPAGTVRWRLKRALDDLRAALDARYRNDRQAWCAALAPLAAGSAAVIPVSGGVKLAAGLAVVAALGVWIVAASGPDEGRPVTSERAAAVDSRELASGSVPALRVAPSEPSPPSGSEPGPQGRLAASAAAGQRRNAAGAATTGGPSPEVIERVMQVGNAPIKGNQKAPVTIVTFAEFQCPFCQRAQPTLDDLMKAYPNDVRLVWKNLPLGFHEHAKLAAEAALAAHEQGKFWPMHDRLFANQDALDPASLEEHAKAIGLHVEQFRAALEDKRHLAAVEADLKLAEEAEIRGTPTFMINGVKLAGAQPLESFKAAVETALAKSKGLPVPDGPAPGTPRSPTPEALARAAAPGNAPTRGPSDAKVTIVLFTDFECPFCKNAAPTMDALLAAYPKDVRLVVKNLPLPFHRNATLAAEAALAAHAQGKFWAMHERLFAHQDALDLDALVAHARAVGLDAERFRKALEDHTFRAAVETDLKLAGAAGLRGTPSALVNGRPLVGARPLEFWKTVVDQALAIARGEKVTDDALAKAARPPDRNRRGDTSPNLWPPPRVQLPDALLGERLRVPFPTGDAPSAGSPRAPVEVLYFNDYACRGCGRGKVFVDGLRSTYGKHLRVVARPVPSNRASAGSEPHLVAEAAWAAHEQGKFWAMHDKLFSSNAPLDRAQLETYAEEIGLDLAAFAAALTEGRYRDKVAEDVERLERAGLKERPLLVINGRRADGPAAVIPLVEAALKKAGIKPPPTPSRPGAPTAPPGRLMMGNALSPPQQFHVEKRDANWADAVEKPIAAMLTSDLHRLDPTAKRIDVECRTSLCRLRFQSPKGSAALAAYVKQVYAATSGPQNTGSERLAYLRVRGGPEDPAEKDVARLKSRRLARLFSLRTGREEADPDLPLAKLPE